VFTASTARLVSRGLIAALAGTLFAASGLSLRAQEEVDPVFKISKPGPFTADLGTVASFKVPKGYRYIGKENIKRFNDLTKNLTAPNELGAILPATDEDSGEWYIIFSYNDEGYVKDDEKDSLDAAALLKSMQEAEKEANQTRKKQSCRSCSSLAGKSNPSMTPTPTT